jgi:hypothetical protein
MDSLTDRTTHFLLLVLLTSLALSQPLFSLLGKQAEFLVAHDMRPLSLLLFAIALGVLLPVGAALLPVLLSRFSRVAGDVLFKTLFVLLFTAIALPLANRLGWSGWGAVAAGVFAALLCLYAYQRTFAVRLFFKYLTPAVLVFPLAFLFFSRATPLFMPDGGGLPGAVRLASKPDIVFLVLDEFPIVSLLTPELEINRLRFPNFARLADQSNWYVAATTGAEVTVDAVPEALTGLEAVPDSSELPISSNFPRNLFTLLSEHYQFHVSETNTRLCPRELCRLATPPIAGQLDWPVFASDLAWVYLHLVVPVPWAADLPSVSNGWAGFQQEASPEAGAEQDLENAIAIADLAKQVNWRTRSSQFEAFTASIEPQDQPQLYFFHSLLPHRVWRYLPDGRQYLVNEVWEALSEPGLEHGEFIERIFGHVWQDDELAVQTARKRHLLQVQFVDTLLGRLLDRLQEHGMLQDSLVVVIGDHGASFVPGHPRRAITEHSLSDIAGVPLMIKLPGQDSGQRILTPASLTDVLPTIVETLGAQPGWSFDGASLLGPGPAARDGIQVKNAAGAAFNYSTTQHMQHLQARAIENDLLYGQGEVLAFANIPWAGQLLGGSPAEFAAAPGLAGKAFLAAPQLYSEVDKHGDFFPLHVKGVIEGLPLAAYPADLAISVNGVIRAVTRTFTIPGFERGFEALLPPDALRDGNNDLGIYAVQRDADTTRLTELTREQQQNFVVEKRQDSEFVLDDQQQEFRVHPDRTLGQVSSVEPEGSALINLVGHIPAGLPDTARIAAFANGSLSGFGELADGEFSIPISSSRAITPAQLEVRVFVIDGASAYELQYPRPCSVNWHFAPPASWGDMQCVVEAANALSWSHDRYRGRLDFQDSGVRQFMQEGWVAEQGNVSWTVNQRAELLLPIPTDSGALQFTVLARPFLAPPALELQSVYILANEQPVGAFRLEEKTLATLSFEVPEETLELSPGSLRISFVLPDAVSPKAVGAGEDLRLLGLALTEMLIESVPVAAD